MVLLAVMLAGCADVANDETQRQLEADGEGQPSPGVLVLVVDTHMDEDDGECVPGDCSLREALTAAMDAPPGPKKIEFDSAVFAGERPTIFIGSRLPGIVSPGGDGLTIDASGLPGRLVLDGSVPAPEFGHVVMQGFDITADDVSLIGMEMTGFDRRAVEVHGVASRVTIDLMVFQGNGGHSGVDGTAGGGALRMAGQDHLVRNSEFINNIADGDGDLTTGAINGGAIELSPFGDETEPRVFENVIVRGNIATGAGGGAFIEGANIFINVTFEDNRAGDVRGDGGWGGGGGFYVNGTEERGGLNTFTNIILRNNTASGSGGAAAFSESRVLVQQIVAHDNSAGRWGGGVWVDGGDVTVVDATVFNNSAEQMGGGLQFGRGVGRVTNADVFNNSAIHGHGGGVALAASNTWFTNVSIRQSHASTTGGGVVAFSAIVFFADSRIEENQATTGGGIDFWGGAGDFSNVTVSGNVASRGGGVHVRGGTHEFDDVQIRQNVGQLGGGGMFIEGGDVLVTNGSVEQNRVVTDSRMGGGVWIADGQAIFEDSRISANEASGSGGGIVHSYCEPQLAAVAACPRGELSLLATSVSSNVGAANVNRVGTDSPVIATIQSPSSTVVAGTVEGATPERPYRLDAYVGVECADNRGDRGTGTFLGTAEAVADSSGSASFHVPVVAQPGTDVVVTATEIKEGGAFGNTSLPSQCKLVPAPNRPTGGGGTPCSQTVAAASSPAPEGALASYSATIPRACAGTTVRVTTPDADVPGLDVDFAQEVWGAEVDLAKWAGDGSPASVAAPTISFARYAQVGFGAGVSEAIGQAELTLRLGASEVPDADKASVLVLSLPATWDAQAVASAFVDGVKPLTASGDVYETSVVIGGPAAVAIAFDVQEPSVGVVPPAGDLTGVVLLVPEVADNVIVDRVEFFLDGQRVLVDDSSPFELALDTAAYADGTYTIRVVAYDVVGNVQEWSQAAVFGNAGGAADVEVNEDEAAGGGLGWWVGLLLLLLLAAVVVAAVVVRRRRSGGGDGSWGRP